MADNEPVVTPTNNNGAGEGADPTKTPVTPEIQTFDPSKISDEDFGKVFDDPRTFQHSRFKELTAQAAEAKKLKDAQTKAEEEKLAAEGKFKELAEAKEQEANNWKTKFEGTMVDNSILAQAQKLGAVDTEAVTKLIDRSNIKINDDGSVTGIDDALKALAKDKGYLFKNPNGDLNIGSGTNPSADAQIGVKKFKLSQLRDFKFFQENNKNGEIDKAMASGQIEDDVNVPSSGPQR